MSAAAFAVICALGDSITRGAIGGTLPPTTVTAALLHARVVNHGISGARTWEWLPGGRLLETAKVSCRYDGAQIVMLTLGTNDAFGRNTSSWQYRENLIEITNDLTDAGFTVVLNYPMGSFRTDFQWWRIAEYYQKIDTVVDGVKILAGDTTAPALLANRSLVVDPTHPTEEGNIVLGTAWATALSVAVLPGTPQQDHGVSSVP